MESFALGKVVITRPANRISGRFTAGLYSKMGITEFTCRTNAEYIDKAIRYAGNRSEREVYERLILDNIHKIFREEESIEEWKRFILGKVRPPDRDILI